ncbi:hypothetical protein AAHC03_01074 [Spirometra sp. Aus1]
MHTAPPTAKIGGRCRLPLSSFKRHAHRAAGGLPRVVSPPLPNPPPTSPPGSDLDTRLSHKAPSDGPPAQACHHVVSSGLRKDDTRAHNHGSGTDRRVGRREACGRPLGLVDVRCVSNWGIH